ncbi:MAG TPA: FHA domain-containing protein, partial [Paraburkholderia sp.]
MSAIPLLTLNISGPMARRSVTVDRNGATLGRGADCTVVLADERRAISRVQAHIEWRGDRFTVIDIGGNPTLVNGNALDASREAILHDGDTLSIGAYLIDVVLEGDAATARGTVRGAATLVAPLPEGARAPRDATPTPPPTLSSTPRGSPFPAVPDEPFFAMPAAALTVLRVRTNAAGRSAAPALAKQTVHMDRRDAGTRAATIAPPEKPPASEEPRSAVPVQNDTASPDAVIAALCEGLGIERGRTDGHPPLEFARLIGSLLRDALQGTM